MTYETIKHLSRSLGLYRQARWLNRHLLHRRELASERADLAFYTNMISRSDLVFDVGANYGEKIRVFLQLGARVIAFEPQPDCRRELEFRCGRNDHLTIVQAAVAAACGESTLYVRKSRASSGLLSNWGNSEIETKLIVPIVTLDQAIDEYGAPAYVKINVEGAEYEVVKGLSQPVEHLSFEFHLTDQDHRRNETDIDKTVKCIEHLDDLGRVLVNITPAECLVFGFDQWLTKDEFLKFFLELDVEKYRRLFISMGKIKSYGDILVKHVQE